MGLILSLETSTPVCSIAVHSRGDLLGARETNEHGGHSEKLIGLIDELLTSLDLKGNNLDAIAVSEGPGSYTGLRIGVSTAKGLSFAWGKPIIGIGTLASLARGAAGKSTSGSKIIAMLDARRMEVYREIFDAEFNSIEKLNSEIIDESSFAAFLQEGQVFFIGDAVTKVRNVIHHENAVFLNESISATQMGELAWKKFQKQEFEDLAYFVPNYLKDFKVLKSKKNPLLMS